VPAEPSSIPAALAQLACADPVQAAEVPNLLAHFVTIPDPCRPQAGGTTWSPSLPSRLLRLSPVPGRWPQSSSGLPTPPRWRRADVRGAASRLNGAAPAGVRGPKHHQEGSVGEREFLFLYAFFVAIPLVNR
jgi:hypothetical protein